MTKKNTLSFTDNEIASLNDACAQLMGTRSIGDEHYKPTFDGKRYTPDEKELGAIAFLYDDLERQIAELRKSGDNMPDYTNALQTIEMHRTVVTLISDQLSRMIDGFKGANKESAPTKQEWEEVLLKLHGLLTCEYFESFDLNVKTNINRILGTKVLSMNPEHVKAGLKERNSDEDATRHLTLAMRAIENIPNNFGLAQAMQHAGAFMKKLNNHEPPPSNASAKEVIKRCADGLGTSIKELDEAIALEKRPENLIAARDLLASIQETFAAAAKNKASVTAFLSQPEEAKDKLLAQLKTANDKMRTALAPKQAMMVLTGIADPAQLFSTSDPGEDLERQFCTAAFDVIRPLQDIRDLLHKKLVMKELLVEKETAIEIAKKVYALGEKMHNSFNEKRQSTPISLFPQSNANAGDGMKALSEMEEIMRRTTFIVENLILKAPSPDSTVFVADKATEHAIKEWLDGTARKNIVRFYELFPEKAEEQKQVLEQYDGISAMLKETIIPAIAASKPRISRSGKYTMDSYDAGCKKGEYMTKDIIALEHEEHTRSEYNKKRGKASNPMLGMMQMGLGMGGLGGMDFGGIS